MGNWSLTKAIRLELRPKRIRFDRRVSVHFVDVASEQVSFRAVIQPVFALRTWTRLCLDSANPGASGTGSPFEENTEHRKAERQDHLNVVLRYQHAGGTVQPLMETASHPASYTKSVPR